MSIGVKIGIFFTFLFNAMLLFGSSSDFDLLMGKETPSWEYLQTPEDHRRLDFFRFLFEKNFPPQNNHSQDLKIPKILHLIWLGPESFPTQSIERIEKWISLHPNWSFKFWTDVDRESPHPRMEKKLVSDFNFEYLKDHYFDSMNFGEKAKILSYEILFKEGGVYIDHDTAPCKALDELNEQFDFYCGLEKLGPTILSTSIIPASHLIAAKKKHSILKETMIWLDDHWKELEYYYPGDSVSEITSRILHRSFWAFAEGVDRGIDLEINKDIIFPVSYFSGTHRKATSYATHAHEGKWINPANRFEKRVNRQFNEIIQKNDEAIFLTLALAAISFSGCVFLFLYIRRGYRRKT